MPEQTTPVSNGGIITDATEKEIGIVQQLIDTVSKHALMLIVMIPTAYMVSTGHIVPEAWWTIAGGVVGYYFKGASK